MTFPNMTKDSIKVYIASPYTLGNKISNVNRQIDTAHILMNLNFVPFVPLLNHFQNVVQPRPDNDWITIDNIWLLVCDCVLRLSGESVGADDEVALAKKHNIPVFYSLGELCNYYEKETINGSDYSFEIGV
jgi:hypothetical protein